MASVPMYRWPGYVVEPDGCWTWQRRDSEGYGAAITWRGVRDRAHRIFWRMAGRMIPEGMTLDHLCRNRACVNPAHMEVVTRGENCRRGARAKLTRAVADEMRARMAAGEPPIEVARGAGVSREVAYAIRAGRAWS